MIIRSSLHVRLSSDDAKERLSALYELEYLLEDRIGQVREVKRHVGWAAERLASDLDKRVDSAPPPAAEQAPPSSYVRKNRKAAEGVRLSPADVEAIIAGGLMTPSGDPS